MKYRNDLKYFIRDGELMPIEKFDESLIISNKSVYEVIRVRDAEPLFLEEHLERMQNSAGLVFGSYKIDKQKIAALLRELITENGLVEGNVKVELMKESEDFGLLLYFIPHRYPTEEQYRKGIRMKLQFDERILPNAKISNWTVRGNANKIIDNELVYETLLVNSQGYVTEGSRSNFFLIKDGMLISAPEEWILPGITRMKVLEIARKAGIRMKYEKVHHKELQNFEAAFITGTSPGVLQVREIENVSFEIGHPLYKKIKEAFQLY